MAYKQELCIVCSSPGCYSAYEKIPMYLHESPEEYPKWPKPINKLLAEVTGVVISRSDNLPQNICAICISYLKHAVHFRDQFIRNVKGLTLATLCEKDEENGFRLADKGKVMRELTISDELADQSALLSTRHTQAAALNNKNLLMNQADDKLGCKKRLNSDEGNCYVNALYDKVTNTKSKEQQANCKETHTSASKNTNNNKKPNKPTKNGRTLKEFKCTACSKQFILKENFDCHADTCIEYQFLKLNTACSNLLELRRTKQCAPHDYIRNMLGALGETCAWLRDHYVDAELAQQLDAALGSNSRSLTERETAPKVNCQNQDIDFELGLYHDSDKRSGTPSPPLLVPNKAFTKLAFTNILYEIEKSEALIPRTSSELKTELRPTEKPVAKQGAKSLKAAVIERRIQCVECNKYFDYVTDLETHNMYFHN